MLQMTHTQINSRPVAGLNVKVTTAKLSGENTGKHLYKVEVNKYFLNWAQTNKQKNLIKLSILQLGSFFFFKTNL